MKRILLMIVFFAAGFVCSQTAEAQEVDAQAAVKQGVKMAFEAEEHDFGNVPESGRKVSVDFVYTNYSSSPLVVARVVSACGCVSTKYSKRPIAPGESGRITVTFNPKKQKGTFYKTIQVYTNDMQQRHVLVVKGTVVE